MKKLDVIAVETISVNKQADYLSPTLLNALYQITSLSYHLANNEELELYLLKSQEEGELTILYGAHDEIAGFIRTIPQQLNIGKRPVMAYIANMIFNPNYKIDPIVANFGLGHAIDYKLAHPKEEVVYLAIANNPQAYELINQLSDIIYPKPEQVVPTQIMKVLDAITKYNGWRMTNNQPFIVNSPLVPIRCQTASDDIHENEFKNYYLSVNPDYMQGNSLLVFVPLHLVNIGFGLNYTDMSYHQHKPEHYDSHQAWISITH